MNWRGTCLSRCCGLDLASRWTVRDGEFGSRHRSSCNWTALETCKTTCIIRGNPRASEGCLRMALDPAPETSTLQWSVNEVPADVGDWVAELFLGQIDGRSFSTRMYPFTPGDEVLYRTGYQGRDTISDPRAVDSELVRSHSHQAVTEPF